MLKTIIVFTLISLYILPFPTTTHASSLDSKFLVFLGTGSSDSGGSSDNYDTNKSYETPNSLGFLMRIQNETRYIGVDYASEGTFINNKSGKTDELEPGWSINAHYGFLKESKASRRLAFGGGALAGIRPIGESCPDSYLGYDCYADQEPDTEYSINIGVMGFLTFHRAMVGARITTASQQFLIGYNF